MCHWSEAFLFLVYHTFFLLTRHFGAVFARMTKNKQVVAFLSGGSYTKGERKRRGSVGGISFAAFAEWGIVWRRN